MRNIIIYRRYINLVNLSIPTVRLEHSRTVSLLCYNNVFVKQTSNILEHSKTFSTTIALAKGKDRGKDKKKGAQVQQIDLREMGEVINVEKLTTQLENVLEKLKENFANNVSVRTSAGAIEDLQISFDGSQYLLQELVQINRTRKMVTLNASEFPQAIPDIISTLAKNQMNLNPQQDGTTIFIPIPTVTKEYRQNLSKSAKSYFQQSIDHIRDIRNKEIKKVKNVDKLPQDVSFRVQAYIELFINQYITKAEQILETKQKELMG